jgi:hypothetical protein
MVKPFYAVVADRAMGAARRPIQHAGVAVFGLHSNSIDNNILHSGQAQWWSLVSSNLSIAFKTFRFWRMCIPRYDTWIPRRSEKQKTHILQSDRITEMPKAVSKEYYGVYIYVHYLYSFLFTSTTITKRIYYIYTFLFTSTFTNRESIVCVCQFLQDVRG